MFKLEVTYNSDLIQQHDGFRADQNYILLLMTQYKCLLICGTHHLSRKPALVFDHPFCIEMLTSSLNLLSCSFEPFLICPISGSCGEELSTHLSASPCQEAVDSNEITPQSFSKLDTLQVLCCSA